MKHSKLRRSGTKMRAAMLSGVALIAADAALAESNNPSSDTFRRLDSDRNGFLSQAELDSDTSLRGSFATIDRNRDQRISTGEFTAASATAGKMKSGPNAFDALDTDHNGTLSASELSAARGESRRLDQFDSNRDGRVSREEYDRTPPASTSKGTSPKRPATTSPGALEPGKTPRQQSQGNPPTRVP